MQLAVTNLSTDKTMLPGYIEVDGSGSVTLTDQDMNLLPEFEKMVADGTISVKATREVGDALEVVVDIDTTANVTGGGTTAVVGFQVKTPQGFTLEEQCVVSFGTYDDANGVTAASHATLNTATAGTILSGAGTNVLQVLTDAHGKFTCTLTNTSDETVYQIATQVGRSPMMDTKDYDAVTFSA